MPLRAISHLFSGLLAEGAGFEPAIRFPVYTLSRRAPSTTRPPLLCSRIMRIWTLERVQLVIHASCNGGCRKGGHYNSAGCVCKQRRPLFLSLFLHISLCSRLEKD